MDTEKVRYTLGRIAGMAEELADILDEPEIEVGQYWQWDTVGAPGGRVFRVQAVYTETKRCRIRYLDDVEKDWYWKGIVQEARLLSDDEAGQALIEEAERRGLLEREFLSPEGFTIHPEASNLLVMDYNAEYDALQLKGDSFKINLCKQGNWAEIIEDEWEVKHQQITEYPYVTDGNIVITSVYDESELTEEQAEAIADALNNMED